MHNKPKVRFQQRPKHNKPRMRASTAVKKAAGLKKPFKASKLVKRTS